MRSRRRSLLLASGVLAVVAAGPPADDLLRRANAAFLRDDPAAGPLYEAAGERAADPGLVAFNAAAVRFAAGDFRDAERHYLQALADRECPPERRARALYNRGVCLVRRGGDAGVYRAAVGSFAACLDAVPADPALAADARHNLELAKLLWAEAVKKSGKPAAPSEPSGDDLPPPPPKPDPKAPGPSDTDDPNATGKTPKPNGQPTQGKPSGTPTPTEVKAPGAGTAEVLRDDEVHQPLSAEDVRERLRRAGERLTRERGRTLELLYGPDKPGVRDW